MAQHTAESLWLSELATCLLFLRLSLRKIILKERVIGKPEAYRHVLRQSRLARVLT